MRTYIAFAVLLPLCVAARAAEPKKAVIHEPVLSETQDDIILTNQEAGLTFNLRSSLSATAGSVDGIASCAQSASDAVRTECRFPKKTWTKDPSAKAKYALRDEAARMLFNALACECRYGQPCPCLPEVFSGGGKLRHWSYRTESKRVAVFEPMPSGQLPSAEMSCEKTSSRGYETFTCALDAAYAEAN